MLSALLTRFWIIFLPLIFYLIWAFVMSRRAGDGRTFAQHVRSGVTFWITALTMMLLIGCFVWWAFTQEADDMNATYVPPTVVDGKVVSGHTASGD